MTFFFQSLLLISGNDTREVGKNQIKLVEGNVVAIKKKTLKDSKQIFCFYCVLKLACYQSDVQKCNYIFYKRIIFAHSPYFSRGNKHKFGPARQPSFFQFRITFFFRFAR